jgi:signal transduction histidine kinase
MMEDGLKLTFKIINSLRNYTGVNQAKVKTASIKDILIDVYNLTKNKKPDNVKVDIAISDEVLIECYPVSLHQIFANLVVNAYDAMRANDKHGSIDVSYSSNSNLHIIRFKDNGAGIPKDDQTRIFDAFYTTKEIGKGTGLGLHIVRNEVNKHGGTIEFNSSDTSGTTFLIKIPKVLTSEVA